MTIAIVPRVSGGEEEHGHLEEFRTDPIGLMQRVRDECGDVGWFQLADKHAQVAAHRTEHAQRKLGLSPEQCQDAVLLYEQYLCWLQCTCIRWIAFLRG